MTAKRTASVALIFMIAASGEAWAQARSLKKIRPNPPAAAPDATPSPMQAESCIQAVHQIAAAWSQARIDEVLHEDFPNRDELIDTIRRETVGVTNVTLTVEAVTSTSFTPAREVKGRRVTDCIADVVTRLLFDDPETGERVRREPGRAQWRIELELPQAGGGAR